MSGKRGARLDDPWHPVVVDEDEVEAVHLADCPLEWYGLDDPDLTHRYAVYCCAVGYELENVGWDTIFPDWNTVTDEGRPEPGGYAVRITWYRVTSYWEPEEWDAEIETLRWAAAAKETP